MQSVPSGPPRPHPAEMDQLKGHLDQMQDDSHSSNEKLSGSDNMQPKSQKSISTVVPPEHKLEHKFEPEEDYFLVKWATLSSSLPLIAGALGPVSNLFSIVALVEPWIIQIDGRGTHVSGMPQHGWVIGLNSLSLFLGVVANFFLLLNFSGRIKYNLSQSVTILSFYVASFLLVALLVDQHRTFVGMTIRAELSEGYWCGVITAVLYFICAFVLTWNETGHLMGLYPASFILTSSQRTLMLQILCITIWLAGGAGVFSRVLEFSYADALYYCDVTILTIGLGDLLPWRDLGRALCLPYALIGVLIVGLVVSSFRSLVISSSHEKKTINQVERLRVKHLNKREMVQEERTGEYSFQLMRDIQKTALKRAMWSALFVSTLFFCMFWLVGALIFSKLESWSFFHGLYFCSLCLLTIGYGDLVPTSAGSKSFFVLWSLIAIPLMTIFISSLGDTIIAGVIAATNKLGDLTLTNVGSDLNPDFTRSVFRRLTGDLEAANNAVTSPDSRSEEATMRGNQDGELDEDIERELVLVNAIQRILQDLRKTPHKKYSYEEWSYLAQALDREFDWLAPDSPIRFPIDEPALLLRLYWASLKQHLRKRRLMTPPSQDNRSDHRDWVEADEVAEEEEEDVEVGLSE